MTSIHLIRCDPGHSGFAQLLTESRSEGYSMVERLAQNWQNGSSRFDGPGEFMSGALIDDRLVGVGGLCKDPYDNRLSVGRMRHFYVLRVCRGFRVGRALLVPILHQHFFRTLNARAPKPAFPFYEKFGFSPVVSEAHVTHRLAR